MYNIIILFCQIFEAVTLFHKFDHYGLLRVKPIFSLIKNLFSVGFKHTVGYFLSAMGRQTVHYHYVVFSLFDIIWNPLNTFSRSFFSFSCPMEAHTSV